MAGVSNTLLQLATYRVSISALSWVARRYVDDVPWLGLVVKM